MIVTDRAVFLQLPKCASTNLQRTLKQHFQGRQFGKHSRIESAPIDDVKGKTIIGGVRDPHSWYLSLWQFGCSQRGINWKSSTSPVIAGKLPVSVSARLENADVRPNLKDEARHLENEAVRDPKMWTQLYSDPDDVSAFRIWLGLIHEPRYQFFCFPDYGYSSYRNEVGLFTHVFLQLYAKSNEGLYGQGGQLSDVRLTPEAVLPDRLIQQANFSSSLKSLLFGKLQIVSMP